LGYGRGRRRGGGGSPEGGLLIIGIIVVGALSYFADYIGWPATVALIVGILTLTVRYLIRKASLSTPKAQDLSAGLQNVGAMSGGQFEVFVAQVLRAIGYKTTVLGGSGDQGVYIIAVGSDGRVAVQCKNYKRAVGNKPVQEVYAGARHHKCDSAWVIAPEGYTKGAHELASSVRVLLFDANSMRSWIKAIDDAEKQASGKAQTA
jgi:HJR/Mrr/RecB family endonuclease